MKNNRLILIISFTMLIISSLFAARNVWWCIPSAGYIEDTDDGATCGQTAIGDVGGTSSIGDGTYGFWHTAMTPEICFDIDHTIWDIDSLNVVETRTMIDEEAFVISNCGNTHLTFGLTYVSSAPTTWAIGHIPDENKFVLRAQFNDSPSAPLTYDTMRDFVKDVVTWSNEDVFGTGGFDYAYHPLYLWMQFQGPAYSDSWELNIITLELTARVNLY